ncbi:MAG: ATP-binding cassette domain-containing protein [Bacteroidetes bacterium]|nr:ATP-binding cassette domain-containing protein [Bacteroidota bacterium]MBK8343326.1 ATP-binding cassette domain-containing protein [Bacteroidota bacterium]
METNLAIDISDLHISFGEQHILNGVNLSVKKGENLVVLGRSGSGKSVLIKIIAGLLKPDSGKVITLGKDMNTINEKDLRLLRQKIGFSFQNSALYDSMTIYDNIAFPLLRNAKKYTKAELDKAIIGALDAVGLAQTAQQMPAELSGGQRKRIGIARTLILNPELMLYDEPTAGLDPITCIEINNLIVELQQRFNSSAIIITHDLTCAKTTGHRIAVLLDGKFIREGSFESVFATDEPLVKQFYEYNFIN